MTFLSLPRIQLYLRFPLLCILLNTIPHFSHTQSSSLKFNRINVESGLSHGSINNMVQDSQGFIWFATQFGLNRYDGRHFETYIPDSHTSGSLKSWVIQTVYEDSKHNIWIGTHVKGLHRFVREADTFQHYSIPHEGELIMDAPAILEDHNQVLYVGTKKRGLYTLDPQTDQLVPVEQLAYIPPRLHDAKINTLMEDHLGRLWVGTQGNGLFIWQADRSDWKSYPLGPPSNLFPGTENVRSLYQDTDNRIWIGTERGLLQWKEPFEAFTHWQVPDLAAPDTGDVYVRALYEDSQGTFWIGTESGLFTFSWQDSSFYPHLNQPENSFSISNNTIYSLLEDRSGVLWIGTDNGGINYLEERQNSFSFNGGPNHTDTSLLDLFMVRAIAQTQEGKFLIGTTKKGIKYGQNLDSGCDTYQSSDLTLPDEFVDKIYSIQEGEAGEFWIATQFNRIFKFNTSTRNWKYYPLATCAAVGPVTDNNLSINYMKMYKDAIGDIWATALTYEDVPGGIYKYDPKRDTFLCWTELFPKAKQFPAQDIYSLEIQGDIFWIGTTTGLYKFSPNSGILATFQENPSDPHSLINNHIRLLHLGRDGTLWLGSINGLNAIDTQTGEITQYRDDLNWLSGGVMAFEEDQQGNIWVSAQQGIIKINPNKELITYDNRDGLFPVNEFIMYASFRNPRTGVISFGGNDGIMSFHPDSLKENAFVPPVIITRLTKYRNKSNSGGIQKEVQSLIEKERIQLSYHDKILNFEIAVLNFKKGYKNKFKYKLEGFQNDWIELGNENKFTLTNLEPKTYQLLVKGANNDGIWNEDPDTLVIEVLPPWWGTSWAKAIFLLVGLLAFRAIVLNIRRKEKAQSKQQQEKFEFQKLKELDELRTQFFTRISHEFRTPLTLIEGPAREQIGRLKKDGSLKWSEEQGYKYFDNLLYQSSKLLNLVNQLMDLAKLEAGGMKLEVSKHNISSLLQRYFAQFESLARQRQVHFSLYAPQEDLYLYLDEEKVDTIISNLISNAFKFTPDGGKIELRIEPNTSHMQIEISNTGHGIPREAIPHVFDKFYQVNGTRQHQEGMGIGLALVKELVELHKGSIEVQSYLELHTTFTLKFLRGKKHYKENEIVVRRTVSPPTVQAHKEPTNQEPLPAATSPNKATLLVVEDHNGMQEFLMDLLSQNYNVIKSRDGDQGWEKTLQHIPDLVISDIMMPGLSGTELCERIKTDIRTCHIPVILLTARAGERSRIGGFDSGADSFISKPFAPEELLLQIRNQLTHLSRIKTHLQKSLLAPPPSHEFIKSLDTLSKKDQTFVQQAIACVEQHLDHSSFGVNQLSETLNMSRVHLFRKFRAIINMSPQDFIQTIRLNKAAQLLCETEEQISQIAYAVGFSSPSHFSERFRKYFECSPTEYRQTHKNPIGNL